MLHCVGGSTEILRRIIGGNELTVCPLNIMGHNLSIGWTGWKWPARIITKLCPQVSLHNTVIMVSKKYRRNCQSQPQEMPDRRFKTLRNSSQPISVVLAKKILVRKDSKNLLCTSGFFIYRFSSYRFHLWPLPCCNFCFYPSQIIVNILGRGMKRKLHFIKREICTATASCVEHVNCRSWDMELLGHCWI